MKQCSDSHDKIIYEGNECPLCQERLVMDSILDQKTDIDQDNIMDLFRAYKKMDKRLRVIESRLGVKKRSIFQH